MSIPQRKFPGDRVVSGRAVALFAVTNIDRRVTGAGVTAVGVGAIRMRIAGVRCGHTLVDVVTLGAVALGVTVTVAAHALRALPFAFASRSLGTHELAAKHDVGTGVCTAIIRRRA